MTVIARETVNDIDYAISVDGGGVFYADVDGSMVQAVTKQQLIDRLKLVKRAKPVAVAATLRDYSEQLIDITLTGIHAANKNIVYREDGQKGAKQISHYGNGDSNVLRQVSPAEREEYAGLLKARKAAEHAVEKWVAARKMNPKTAIEEARAADAVAAPPQVSNA